VPHPGCHPERRSSVGADDRSRRTRFLELWRRVGYHERKLTGPVSGLGW
jgi:hypothetical protein